MINFIRFIRIVKLQYKRDLHCSSSQGQIEFTFPVNILFQDSSSSSVLELTVQNKMKDRQICNIISSRVIFDIVGHFYGNE